MVYIIIYALNQISEITVFGGKLTLMVNAFILNMKLVWFLRTVIEWGGGGRKHFQCTED